MNNKEEDKAVEEDYPFNLDCSLMLNKFLEEKKSKAQKRVTSTDYKARQRFESDLYKQVMLALENENASCYAISEWTENTLLSLPISLDRGAFIFHHLCILMEQKKELLIEKEAEDKEIIKIDHALNAFQMSAVAFCRKKLCQDVIEEVGDDSATLLIRAKELQSQINNEYFNLGREIGELNRRDAFMMKAAHSLQVDIEKTINLMRERDEYRKTLGTKVTIEEDESEAKDGKTKHVTPRTQKQVFLALGIIFRALQSGGDQTDNGKLMSFLSGYSSKSMRQNHSYSDGWEDNKESLEYIKRLGIECKLPKLVRSAEEQINKLPR